MYVLRTVPGAARMLRGVLSFGSLALLALGAGPALAMDLSVQAIEVTQGMQTATNTVPLIARRSTAVRATLRVTSSNTAVSGVTGRLRVFVNNVQITPAAGLAPINAPFTAPLAPQRGNENHTLNFELPGSVNILASNDVDFRVDITPLAAETNKSNNSGFLNNRVFANRFNPSLFFTRVNYTPSGLGLPALDLVQQGRGDMFVRGILPLNDRDPNLYRPALLSAISFSKEVDTNDRVDALTDEGNELLSLIGMVRQLQVILGIGATGKRFMYGWVAGPVGGNGLASVGGRNAFGNTDLVRYQRTYAHELTHNFGFEHINQQLGEIGWDVGARLQNNPAGNNTTGRLKGATLNDIQVAGQVTNSAWVSLSKYTVLTAHPTLILPEPPPSARAPFAPTPRVLVVHGIMDPAGQRLVKLLPAFRFPWPSEPTPPLRGQQFRFAARVRLRTGGEAVVPFNALVADDSEGGGRMQHGFFEVMIPLVGEPVELRITDITGRTVLGRIVRSNAAPQVVITSPAPGSRLSRQQKVTWRITDPDTPAAQLMSQIAFSPDAGKNFVPVGVNLTGTEFTFDATQLPRASQSGILRVIVSDGLNTSFADVRGLSTP